MGEKIMLTSYEHKKVPFKYAYDVAIIGVLAFIVG